MYVVVSNQPKGFYGFGYSIIYLLVCSMVMLPTFFFFYQLVQYYYCSDDEVHVLNYQVYNLNGELEIRKL